MQIVSLILSLGLGGASVAASIFVKDKNKRNRTFFALASLLVVCAILIFMTPIFATKLMKDTANRLFGGNALDYRFNSSEVNGFVSSGKKIKKLPQDTIICPGHGPFTTLKNELKNNMYFNQ